MNRLRIALKPDLVFWACFLALNSLLFAPAYLLNQTDTAFWPIPPGEVRSGLDASLAWLAWRDNPDIFRLNLEFLLLIALWAGIRPLRRPFVGRLITGAYLLTLVYFVYDAVFRSLYLAEPVLYSQARLLTDGLAFVVEHVGLPALAYVGGGLGLLALLALVVLLMQGLLDAAPAEQLHPVSRILLALLFIGGLAGAAWGRGRLAAPEAEISSLAAKLERNIQASLDMRRTVHAYDDSAIRRVHNFEGYHLHHRPNIYLIFVESYGSVLYKRPDWQAAYRQFLQGLEQEFSAAGWRMASTLSRAPTWGGGSWMSYTSALFGIRIDSDPQYTSLLDRYQAQAYPDLGRWLKNQGYRYYRLSSISAQLSTETWSRYLHFYGVDEWFRYGDLAYQGPRYGWGPAPPDQYALNWARERMAREHREPYFFFTITQNSHYPWVPLPQVAEDWRALNQAVPEPEAGQPKPTEQLERAEHTEHEIRRQNYLNAIRYELRTLTDFVLSTPDDEDALFVLVGDHQPPRVSRREDGWDTPVHVISRDGKLIESLAEYGFQPGLALEEPRSSLNHEALYSMLVRLLVARYGEEPSQAPAFLPLGAPFAASLLPDR